VTNDRCDRLPFKVIDAKQADFLMASPLSGMQDLDPERDQSSTREVNL
jgi:hypothetical protein